MAEAIRTIEQFRIKFNDVFHLKNLYVMMHEFLIDETWMGIPGFLAPLPNSTHRDIEKFYFERHHQKAVHRGGMELWAWWRLKKNPFGKNNNYYEFRMDIDFHCMYMQKQEIMHQGKKIRVDKGELEIFIRPKVVRSELAESWDKHWFLKHVKEIYEQRIISQDLDKLEKELWREAYRFQGVIKSYLNLRNFIPVPEPIHPKLYGWEGQF